MNFKEIDKLWHKAMHTAIVKDDDYTRYEFAALIEQHLIKSGYRRCAEGQRTTQWCGQLEKAVKAERESCAKVCDAKAQQTFSGQCQVWGDYFARVIRARGEV